ncbi:hypothetical protein SAMN02927921_02262 [Sinomicrobium oceani]|uniref:Uncharacterized protein n=1 Tax=Sinomicrobium oceani TaxID=1150368 RepID=A0A1K1Q6N5_9FLAO|nr:hypothetical protein [Sinomicrobium oceani]SFW54782.1 hypothetical protein SAMN02927921_02262 [Sinomicrobium oceani]
MTTKKIMSIIAVLIIVGIAGFIFLLYTTIKTKSADISGYEPFKAWVGQTVRLDKETLLFEQKAGMNNHNRYPYILLDSLHPQWQHAEEAKDVEDPDLKEVMAFPAGTHLKIEKAIQYTNGVSGFSSPMLFGTINYAGQTYKTGYQWGEADISKDLNNIEKCWKFHRAPWQAQEDTSFYALPKAGIW